MFGSEKRKEKEIRQVIEEEQKDLKENHLKRYHYLISLLFILVGLVFIVYVQIDVPFICTFLACIFAFAGIISILSYCIRDVATGYYRLDLVYGIIAGFTALVFYTKQDVLEIYFPLIAGFILFANGVVKLQHSIDMKRIDRKMKKVTEMWLVVMIFALMCIAAGFITVYMTPDESRTLFLFVGVSFIISGASDVFTHIVFNRKVRLFKKGAYVTEEKEPAPVRQEDNIDNPTAEYTDYPVMEPEPEESSAPVPDVMEETDYADEYGKETATADFEPAVTFDATSVPETTDDGFNLKFPKIAEEPINDETDPEA